MLLFQTSREIKFIFNILYSFVFTFWEKKLGEHWPPAPPLATALDCNQLGASYLPSTIQRALVDPLLISMIQYTGRKFTNPP